MNQPHQYPVAIPASAVLASADPRDEQAAPILVGDVIGNNILQNSEAADRELATRKRLRLEAEGAVTVAEVQASRRRQMAVEIVEVETIYGMGNVGMMAAIQTLSNQIAALPAQVNTQIAAINTQIAALPTAAQVNTQIAAINTQIAALPTAAQVNTHIAAINTRFDVLNARMDNTRARRINGRMHMTVGQQGPWVPLVVERVGANAIGMAPNNQPASSVDVLRLTGNNIMALQQAFNLQGTFAGDNIAVRRDRVLAFYTVE